jgi:hypothetical protein
VNVDLSIADLAFTMEFGRAEGVRFFPSVNPPSGVVLALPLLNRRDNCTLPHGAAPEKPRQRQDLLQPIRRRQVRRGTNLEAHWSPCMR